MSTFFERWRSCQPGWLLDGGPLGQIVIGTRGRLHRNLSGFHFPTQARLDEKSAILDEVGSKVSILGSFAEAHFLNLAEMTEVQRKMLVEMQLIRPQAALGARHTGVWVGEHRDLSLVVNDQDHLQIQLHGPGFSPEAVLEKAMAVEAQMETPLNFSYKEDLGYLTAFAGSVGTGLHFSALLHLPGLVLADEVDKIINALKQLRFSVRGLFGTGKTVRGALFLVSSQVTLGRDEEEIMNDFKYHLGRVIMHEMSARQQLHARDRWWLEDLVHRSFAVLKSARLITAQESFDRLSHVRLGVGLGILPPFSSGILNTLLFGQQSGHLELSCGESLTGSDQAHARALFLRGHLDQPEN